MRQFAFLAVVVALLSSARADERVLSFDSDIQVNRDGSLVVTETITVNAEGQQIRRGIYRDFPTDYTLPGGGRMRVGFDVLEVGRDGGAEDYHTERLSNGVRIYFGSAERFLTPGVHAYRLTYRTTRQIGFFDAHDELYWNVTSNDWKFPIDQARAVVRLPSGVRPTDFTYYTGPVGARGGDASAYVSGAGVVFETTRALSPGEGLTIAVAWPKGHVDAPSALERRLSGFGDLRQITLAVLGLMVIVVYYVAVWLRVGRDPEKGAIYPRYEPPANLSPAATRFIARLGFDQKALAAALVSLAVKGAIRLHETEEGVFTIEKLGEGAGLSADEAAMVRSLLAGGGETLALKQAEHRTLRRALSALKAKLSTNYEKTYFLTNRGWILPGVALSLAVIAGLALLSVDPGAALFLSIWLAGWSAGCYVLFLRVAAAWGAVRGNLLGLGRAILLTVFALPFIAGLAFGAFTFAEEASWPAVALIAVLIGVNLLFLEVLKAPTLLGRRVLDAIEGFKLYLSVAEQDRLDWAHEPERTPELFEKFLPYAIALDVETRWGEKFADVLEKAAAAGTYQPRWYAGRHFTPGRFGNFPAALGSALVGAVAAAAHAPGTSSGFGGGGSSGGGGGGGGGGGW